MGNPENEPYRAEEPPYRAFGQAAGYDGTDRRVAYCHHRGFQPVIVDGSIGAEQQDYEQNAKGRKRQGERTRRPREPGGGASTHPADSLTLFTCPFRHNTTLP